MSDDIDTRAALYRVAQQATALHRLMSALAHNPRALPGRHLPPGGRRCTPPLWSVPRQGSDQPPSVIRVISDIGTSLRRPTFTPRMAPFLSWS